MKKVMMAFREPKVRYDLEPAVPWTASLSNNASATYTNAALIAR